HPPLGAPGDSGVRLLPLDADRRGGAGRQRRVGAVRRRGAALVQPPRPRPRIEHRRVHLEVAAVLDRDLLRGSGGDPAGGLRRSRRRWSRRLPPLLPRHPSAAGKPLSGLHAALHPVDDRGFHHGVSGIRRRARVFHERARHAGHSLCVRRGPAGARRRRRDVGAPGDDPDRDHPSAHAADPGAATVRATGTPGRRRSRPRYRRLLVEAGSGTLGVLLLIWSLTPIYNMLLIALDPDEGDIEFAGTMWPSDPSLHSFRAVVAQEYWLVEDFWRQFGNSA